MGSTETRTKGHARPSAPPGRRASSSGFRTWVAPAALVAVMVILLVACGESDEGTAPSAGEELAHVHGLGVNPANGDLYAATHFGLFRVPAYGAAERVGEGQPDTMGITVVGADHFLALLASPEGGGAVG